MGVVEKLGRCGWVWFIGFFVVFVVGCRCGVLVVVVIQGFLVRCGLPVWDRWVLLVVRRLRNVSMFVVCVWRCDGRWVCTGCGGWLVSFLFFVCILRIVDFCLLFFRSRCKGSWAWVGLSRVGCLFCLCLHFCLCLFVHTCGCDHVHVCVCIASRHSTCVRVPCHVVCCQGSRECFDTRRGVV
jgi:hypothetical protein